MTRPRIRAKRRSWAPGLRARIAITVWLSTVVAVWLCALVSLSSLDGTNRELLAQKLDAVAGAQRVALLDLGDDWARFCGSGHRGLGAELSSRGDEPWRSAWWCIPVARTPRDVGPAVLGTPQLTNDPRPEAWLSQAAYVQVPVGSDEPIMSAVDPLSPMPVAMSSRTPQHSPFAVVVATKVDNPGPSQHHALALQLWNVGVGASLLAALGAWLLAGVVVQPLRRMGVVAERLGAGDLDARMPVSGHDELAMLGVQFNTMAERMQTNFEAQRRFVADTAHELRTPVAALVALSAAVENPATRDQAALMVAPQLRRLGSLAEGLLALNRFDAQREELTLQATDVGQLIDTVVLQLDATAEVRIHVDRGVERRVDPVRVGLIVRNLIANALLHGAPPVEVWADGLPDGLKFKVTDHGGGVPAAQREAIFGRFVRGDTNRTVPGSGLGLALARENARLHGGDVVLEADGRTFHATVRTSAPQTLAFGLLATGDRRPAPTHGLGPARNGGTGWVALLFGLVTAASVWIAPLHVIRTLREGTVSPVHGLEAATPAPWLAGGPRHWLPIMLGLTVTLQGLDLCAKRCARTRHSAIGRTGVTIAPLLGSLILQRCHQPVLAVCWAVAVLLGTLAARPWRRPVGGPRTEPVHNDDAYMTLR